MMFSDTNVKNIKQHILSLFKVFLICSITTILSLTLSHLGIVKENLLMIFLVGVLLSTIVIQGYIYGFLTAFLSVFLFNYFFTKPLHTFLIGNQQDILLILFFFLAALICGLMSSDSRNQMLRAQENEQTSQFLYEMTESFLKITGVENIVQNALNYIYEKIGYSCMVILDSEKFANHDHTFSTPDCPDGLNAESGCSFPIESRTHRMGVIIFEKNLPLNYSSDGTGIRQGIHLLRAGAHETADGERTFKEYPAAQYFPRYTHSFDGNYRGQQRINRTECNLRKSRCLKTGF